jgi:hypothetical protein
MLVELELPRLLAPDLPSTRSSLKDLKCTHSNYRTWSPALLFFVTTSPCREWVICAPAAFLGCGSRFSGSLSGIEPWFSVTRYNHCRHITYSRKLIGQTFERYAAGSRPCGRQMLSRVITIKGLLLIDFDLIKAPLRKVRASCMY